MEDPNLKKILEFLLKAKGFDGRHYKPNYIKRRIAVRMRAVGAGNYQDYFHVLKEVPREAALLFERLTIHVTEFFRDPEVYKSLKLKVLPALTADLHGRIKVWSAGCSTGEEPYSIAMLLEEWKDSNPGLYYEILATDLDPETVKMAERGEYAPEAIRGLSKHQTAKWFQPHGAKFRTTPELRKKIRFRNHDLLGDWGASLSGFRVIFCRNLLIYLAGAEQQKVYEKFAGALLPGGFLVLGLTETLLGASRRFFKCVDVRHRIYQVTKENEELGMRE